ncbi:RNA polymerase subunit sigma-70 [Adhaeribacter arboris]|uniref:RNA polymerase subunit sigma-70 n=1 Tax=Adhaeribacter arboris TaxID=2072846 RepID=A0A2T2YJ49_9BACT|nr:sigma-70 family RNA polymerase sigma factor [Adhaeribacter arboris]PSR55515.1 RNA polymerase subunit sigma-70 [Adhaeribacter arboris]
MNQSDKKEFIQLIQAHQRLINSLCAIYYTAPEDRKDCRQDIVLQLWRAYPNFRHESKVSTWIYQVALHTILNQNKKEKRRVATEPYSEVNLNIGVVPIFADDAVQQLQQAINLLADVDKALVILYLEGYSHREIADILHLTETNVSTRFGRVKAQLQKIFKIKHYEPR